MWKCWKTERQVDCRVIIHEGTRFTSHQGRIYVKMCTVETFQHKLYLPELLSKNTGHHAVKQGSDFSFRVPGSICLMRMVIAGLVPRLWSSEPSKRMPEWWCPRCSLKPSSCADRRTHKDTGGGSQLTETSRSSQSVSLGGRQSVDETGGDHKDMERERSLAAF